MTIPEALKQLYTAIGGTASDVADCTLTVDVLNKFAAYLEGDSNATQNVEAIMNIVSVAGNLIPDPTLIDKNITANGTYNASSDSADGYKKVVVDVPSVETNNARYIANESDNIADTKTAIEYMDIPNGYYSVGSGVFGTALKEIKIPSSVTTIGSTTFTNCSHLEKITINKAEGSISGAPWGAPASCQIVWLG